MALAFNSSLTTLSSELEWLDHMIEYRFTDYFKQSNNKTAPVAPDLTSDDSYYACTIKELQIDDIGRLLIMIALAPHIRPAVFDIFFTKNAQFDRVYAEFGGIKGEKHSGFVPTAETASFIIAGNDLETRFKIQKCFDENNTLYRNNILALGFTNDHEPIWSGELIISKEFLTHVTLNEAFKPRYSPTFPAQRLATRLDWDDAVFDKNVKQEIQHIQSWIRHEYTILESWKLDKYLKKGYRVLFYGPPGTGKSMTAAILGKSNDMDVYRVDLSAMVSKYIGETEKNLSRLFDMAENKRWILFFDEADALFGRRVSSQSSNDMFANQQVAYLLQRVEEFNGVVILASNFKDNIDEAFLRRFQSVVYFPKPDSSLRLSLWKKYFATFDLSKANLERIANDYEVSGGNIINILRYCSITSAERNSNQIDEQDIIRGVKKELLKEGVTL